MAEKDSEEGAAAERAEIQRALRETRGSWQDGNGVRGPQPVINPTGDSSNLERRTDAPGGSIVRRGSGQDLPGAPALPVASTQGLNLNASFLLKDASTTLNGVTTRKVLVMDGKINGQSPAGMPSGTYKLTVDNSLTTVIFAAITFNPQTLTETSRYLFPWVSGSAANIESRIESTTLGYLFWQIGYTYFTAGAKPKFVIYQTRLGDINVHFAYGANNGVPGLLPINSDQGWLDLLLA